MGSNPILSAKPDKFLLKLVGFYNCDKSNYRMV